MIPLTFDTGIAALAGAIAGGIASLIAPWSNWGVEKRRKKLSRRREFINDCRRMINERRFNSDRFRESSHYSVLRPYLSRSLQKEIKRKRYTPGKVMSPEQRGELAMKEFAIKKRLFNEISILEKKWGLI